MARAPVAPGSGAALQRGLGVAAPTPLYGPAPRPALGKQSKKARPLVSEFAHYDSWALPLESSSSVEPLLGSTLRVPRLFVANLFLGVPLGFAYALRCHLISSSLSLRAAGLGP